jgi:hypothetical protein
MLKTLFNAALLLIAVNVQAQTTDSVAKRSPVRTLTYQQYDAYLKGDAATDMARVAEMNHYPMPDKVLKYKAELDLSPIQIKKLTEVNNYMHRRRLQVGGSIIDTEKKLDSLFKHNRRNEGDLIFYTNRYGLYQGELKNAMLQACLATEKLLTPQQIAQLEALLRRK